MRLWIALFLISLFAFQALPVTALGKGCIKAKITAGEASDQDGNDEDTPIPEAGKSKKSGPAVEDYYLHPAAHRTIHFRVESSLCSFAPLIPMAAANGHAQLHTPPPDRH